MASALEQLAKLESALGELGEWRQAMLGPSGFCRDGVQQYDETARRWRARVKAT